MAARSIKIDSTDEILSIAFLMEGKYLVSSDREGNIRRWKMQDGTEMRPPMDAGSPVYSIAVSRDDKWIAAGTKDGRVTVWDAESHEKLTGFTAHSSDVNVVDISPDGTRIVSGSDDMTACVWSLSDGQQWLGPLQHSYLVAAARFSFDGCLIATATRDRDSVRVYDGENGGRLYDFPVKVGSPLNQSLAWASNSKKLFALSGDGEIHCLDASVGCTLSKWATHDNEAQCIALDNNEKYIAVSARSSVSLWDPAPYRKIGTVVDHQRNDILSMAISSNYDLATAGGNIISFRSIFDVHEENPDHTDLRLEQTIQELRNELSESRHTADEKDEVVRSLRAELATQRDKIGNLETTIQLLRTTNQEQDDLISTLRTQQEHLNHTNSHLEQTVEALRDKFAESQRQADKQNRTIGSLHADIQMHETSIRNLKETAEKLQDQLTASNKAKDRLIVQFTESQQEIDSQGRLIRAHELRHKCEFLYSQDRIHDAAASVLEMMNTLGEDMRADKILSDWLSEFTQQCVMKLDIIGEKALNARKLDEAISVYADVLSLGPSDPDPVLMKWASAILTHVSTQKAMSTAVNFRVSDSLVFRAVCDSLYREGRFKEAVECFTQMQYQFQEDTGHHDQHEQWELDFRGRCAKRLERLGNDARNLKNHKDAITYYLFALSLEPTNVNDIRLKHSNELIKLDPSSHEGYEGKYTALLGMRHHKEAYEAFKEMLFKLEQSPDPRIRDLRHQYVDATSEIREAVKKKTDDMPSVLIDTDTGRLYNKERQKEAFEEMRIFDELRSSMTTPALLDLSRIQKEVEDFYQYVMLSHRWRQYEPNLQVIEETPVYKLPETPENSKIQRFCEHVRWLRYRWAWSDTCCIDQRNKRVVEEAITAMFKWYSGSTLTIVHLVGVSSESNELDLLWRSIWNQRGWTYQEYMASKVVQFYTEDWKPYRGLTIFNHKESEIILREMEKATSLPTKELDALKPGLEKPWEKLFLASGRQTEREEDIAHCLFGIFNVALPIMYGEGNQAVSRLLKHILARSKNVTLLAWTGQPSVHYSYLPASLTVYNQSYPPHVPQPLQATEFDRNIERLRSSSRDLSLSIVLYKRLHDISALSVISGCLRLPGFVFPLSSLIPTVPKPDPNSDLPNYRTTAPMLGEVEMKITDDLPRMDGLLLIHPWASFLLDQDFSNGDPQFDEATRALRLVVQLRQRFGALLLAPSARDQYKRVATDSLIMVQIWEKTSLKELMASIRTVNIQ